MKVTGPTEGRVVAGMGTGALANGWIGGGATAGKGWLGGGATAGKGWLGGGAVAGLGCGPRTDLETSSNQRSASDGVRLCEGMMTGDDVGGGTTITGVGADQLLPARTKQDKKIA